MKIVGELLLLDEGGRGLRGGVVELEQRVGRVRDQLMVTTPAGELLADRCNPCGRQRSRADHAHQLATDAADRTASLRRRTERHGVHWGLDAGLLVDALDLVRVVAGADRVACEQRVDRGQVFGVALRWCVDPLEHLGLTLRCTGERCERCGCLVSSAGTFAHATGDCGADSWASVFNLAESGFDLRGPGDCLAWVDAD